MRPPLQLVTVLAGLLDVSIVHATVVSDNTTWSYQAYKSSDAKSSSLNVSRAGPSSPGYLFFQQNGDGAHQYSLFIMSDTNELIWQGLCGDFMGFSLPAPWGYGYGIVQILDGTYESIYYVTIEQENFLTIDLVDTSEFKSWLDFHESSIKSNGTMLVTGYNVAQHELSSVGGPEDGWIADCPFYEIDIKSNEIL